MRVNVPAAIDVRVKIDVVDCPNCGVVFGVAAEFNQRRREDGQCLYCPAGHTMTYTESELDRVRKRLEAERRARAEALAARDAALDQAAAAERERKRAARELGAALQRVHNGVCPHCGRTFARLARHMQSQHPDLRAASERLRLDSAHG